MSESELLTNAKEFWTGGNEELSKKRFNSSASLYYKAITCLCDILIYRRTRVIPSSHTDRFDQLKLPYPDIYKKAAHLFTIYIQSYTLRISAEQAMQVRKGVVDIAKHAGIKGFE